MALWGVHSQVLFSPYVQVQLSSHGQLQQVAKTQDLFCLLRKESEKKVLGALLFCALYTPTGLFSHCSQGELSHGELQAGFLQALPCFPALQCPSRSPVLPWAALDGSILPALAQQDLNENRKCHSQPVPGSGFICLRNSVPSHSSVHSSELSRCWR